MTDLRGHRRRGIGFLRLRGVGERAERGWGIGVGEGGGGLRGDGAAGRHCGGTGLAGGDRLGGGGDGEEEILLGYVGWWR